MQKPLNLDALRSFVVFSETLNFTRAAEALHISQPALHVKVQDLAETLGVPLYRKIGRRLELTEQGKNVARFGREMTQRTESFTEHLRTGNFVQSVTLAAGEGAYLYLLGEAISEFARKSKFPLKLITSNREGIIDSLQSGKAHLGVASMESVPEGFEAALLCKVGQVLVMPANHPLAAKKSVKLRDLAGAKLIVPTAERPHRQMLATALQSQGVNWEVAVEAGGWELMLHFAKLGIGLTVVNSFCAIPRGLVARPLKELPQIHFYVFNLRGSVNAAQSALKEAIMRSVSRHIDN